MIIALAYPPSPWCPPPPLLTFSIYIKIYQLAVANCTCFFIHVTRPPLPFSISRIYRDLTENIINSYPTKGNPLYKLAPEALQEEQDLNSNSAVTLRILSHRFLPFILLVLQGEREEPSPSLVLHVNHSWNKSLLIESFIQRRWIIAQRDKSKLLSPVLPHQIPGDLLFLTSFTNLPTRFGARDTHTRSFIF